MRVLVLGNGGREHAICNALNQSAKITQVYAIPGNVIWSNVTSFPKITHIEFANILKVIKDNTIELVLVGPEEPIMLGIYDYLHEHGVVTICPSLFCSQIESDKIFSKQLMETFKVPTAKFDFAISQIEFNLKIKAFSYPVILKSNNHAFGKGVVIAKTLNEALKYSEDIFVNNFFGKNNKILIEEYMQGEEFSLICMVNGKSVLPLIPVCDHKTINDDNEGPMTGGMGVFNKPNFLSEEDIKICIKNCIQPIATGLANENPYKGFLFAGIMKIGEKTFKVIEYNIRLGDPETEIILALMKSDFLQILIDFFVNNKVAQIEFFNEYALGIVVAAKGYPKKYEKNIDMNFLKKQNDLIFMGINENENNWKSSGGRIFMLIKKGTDVKALYNEIYDVLQKLIPEDVNEYIHYRNDIGKRNF